MLFIIFIGAFVTFASRKTYYREGGRRIMNNKMHDMRVGIERYGGMEDRLEQECISQQAGKPRGMNAGEGKTVNWNMDKYRQMLAALPSEVDDHMRRMEPNATVGTTQSVVSV